MDLYVDGLVKDKMVAFNFLFFFLLGGILGFKLAFIKNYEYYELLNLIGILYDFVAVIFLTYAILLKEEVQDSIADNLSLSLILVSGTLPVSIFAGSILSMLFGGVHFEDTKKFCFAFAFVSIIPTTYVFSSPVFRPVRSISYSPEKRVKILAAVLLSTGFALQFVASALVLWEGLD